MTKRIERTIADYLQSPSDDDPVTELCSHGDAAVDGILSYKGPIPESMHPRDVDDTHLVELLEKVIQRRPELVLRRNLSAMGSHDRYRLLVAAACTENEQFADVILAGLKDRSVYVKLMVLHYMKEYEYLRQPNAVPQLKRLLTQKAMHEDDRKRVEQVLEMIDAPH